MKGNGITPKGYLNLKKSLLKNKRLKLFALSNDNIEKTEILDGEYNLVYKLLKLTNNYLHFNFSKNIYFSSPYMKLRLNYLKCYIDEINYLFINFHINFDINFVFI
jgi:hypothetical protein